MTHPIGILFNASYSKRYHAKQYRTFTLITDWLRAFDTLSEYAKSFQTFFFLISVTPTDWLLRRGKNEGHSNCRVKRTRNVILSVRRKKGCTSVVMYTVLVDATVFSIHTFPIKKPLYRKVVRCIATPRCTHLQSTYILCIIWHWAHTLHGVDVRWCAIN
jgi:hypothetical protein